MIIEDSGKSRARFLEEGGKLITLADVGLELIEPDEFKTKKSKPGKYSVGIVKCKWCTTCKKEFYCS